MPRDPDQEPYEVGYGKPPHHTRFKPGVSGKPRGRRKDAKNLSTLVHDALNEQVVVAGRRGKLSKRQAIIKQLINRLAQGGLRAMQMLLAIMQDIEHRNEAGAAEPTFDGADEKVLEQLRARFGNGSGPL